MQETDRQRDRGSFRQLQKRLPHRQTPRTCTPTGKEEKKKKKTMWSKGFARRASGDSAGHSVTPEDKKRKTWRGAAEDFSFLKKNLLERRNTRTGQKVAVIVKTGGHTKLSDTLAVCDRTKQVFPFSGAFSGEQRQRREQTKEGKEKIFQQFRGLPSVSQPLLTERQ